MKRQRWLFHPRFSEQKQQIPNGQWIYSVRCNWCGHASILAGGRHSATWQQVHACRVPAERRTVLRFGANRGGAKPPWP